MQEYAPDSPRTHEFPGQQGIPPSGAHAAQQAWHEPSAAGGSVTTPLSTPASGLGLQVSVQPWAVKVQPKGHFPHSVS